MNKILHFKKVESSTVSISCGDKSGTAFFIESGGPDQILLTSNHTLSNSESSTIYIHIQDYEDVEVEILEVISEKDISILKIKGQIIESIDTLPLLFSPISYGDTWETYGFPAQRVSSGGRYNGKVSRTNEGTVWDIDLECEQYPNLKDFSGLSGSPLIIDGFVRGVIGFDNNGTLGAIGVSSISDILEKYGVALSKTDESSIPISIEKDISSSIPNNEVLQQINDVVEQHISSSYFLISGSPGSGKTTIAAQIEFENEDYIICDRFFVKVPKEESIPTQIRATPEFFMKWLTEVYCRILYNEPPKKSEKPLNEKIEDIFDGLKQLSNYYKQQQKIAFLIIDGLDDIDRTQINNFLSVLPNHLLQNLKVIFSCTSKIILPPNLQSIIGTLCEIKVTPLSIQNAEIFLTENLEEKELTNSQITELAHKSEGHPLYLRYLTNYILEIEDVNLLDSWIKTIPTIGGNIEIYYDKIWAQLNMNIDEIWVVATLSRLRISVEKSLLFQFLPERTQYTFEPTFTKIQHLLQFSEKVSIYHTSFSDFINSKSVTLSDNIHDNISLYCKANRIKYFSISELVYHLSNGSEANKQDSLEICNQVWVDDCAIHSVNPDVVLSDISRVIGLAAEFGISHKVIGLLLLSQRVDFRYNSLFKGNAFFLVNALLALNRANEAIRYVVRNKILMVSANDALFLLQRFYEYGFIVEAEQLYEAIDYFLHKILEDEPNDESFTNNIYLRFKLVSLYLNSDFEEAFYKFNELQDVAVRMIENQVGRDRVKINKFKDFIGSYKYGYLIWRFNIPPITKRLEETNTFNFDDRSSGFLALAIYHALDFVENSPISVRNNPIKDWMEDLIYSIDKYNLNSDYYSTTLSLLLGRCNRVDLIEKMFINVYSQKEEFNLRKENGVDLNYQAIHDYMVYQECLGFLNKIDVFPSISKNWYPKWEDEIKKLFDYTCILTGKLKRLRADGKEEQFDLLKSNLHYLFSCLIPDLRERIYWKRSYALPEAIFPIIYQMVTKITIDFFPKEISTFVQLITNKGKYQLGQYTEGYTETLFAIGEILSKYPDCHTEAFKVVKVLEEHIINTVENREQRNEYLLRLVELYAVQKNEDKANKLFNVMIDTSMGPAWYKEAQLGIINMVISNIIPTNNNYLYLQKFAAQLHHASGEMTFQRYVKGQQESFVGDLAKIGFLKKSIDYFKYLILPDYAFILQNVESGLVDMPEKGNGYVLGARAIEEQAGVVDLLSNIDCKSSLIAWGLTELFIVGDDRYLERFIKIQTTILNFVEIIEADKLDMLFKRLSRFIVTEVDEEYRYEYLQKIFSQLSESNFEKVKVYLDSVVMKSNNPQNEDKEQTFTNYKKDDDPLDKLVIAKKQAQQKLETENKTGARKIIIEALNSIQKGKYNVWSSRYSHKIDELVDLLSETYTDSKELIKEISDLIINEPYFEGWVVANKLIKLLRNIDCEEEKQEILSVVSEHIELMVRTPKTLLGNYSWLSENEKTTFEQEQDEILLDFLIWFLNHPTLIIKNRTIEVLVWLGVSQPNLIIPALVKEILSDGYKISKELSAAVLHQISDLNPRIYWESFKKCLKKDEENILKVKHFMIQNAILQSIEEVKNNDIDDVDIWIEKIKNTFIANNKVGGDVFIEDEYSTQINSYLHELDKLGILNSEFCRTFLAQVNQNAPLKVEDIKRANKYIERSFNNQNGIDIISDFDNIVRYSINFSITSCVTWNDREKVASILRFYQPTFPENRLCHSFNTEKDRVENAIKELYSGNVNDIFALLKEEKILLNFFSTNFSGNRKETSEDYEIEAFLIPNEKFNGLDHSYYSESFASNNYPHANLEDFEDDVIPLITNNDSFSSLIIGSDIVPSFTTKNISNYLSDEMCSKIESTNWRQGRHWGQNRHGTSQKAGYSITIPLKDIVSLSKEYKLIWQIYHKHETKYLDVFGQKEIS